VVGADGPTHARSFDLTYLRCLPNMVVMAQVTRTNAQMLHTGSRSMARGGALTRAAAGRACQSEGPDGADDRQGEVRRRGQRVAIRLSARSSSLAWKPQKNWTRQCQLCVFVKPLDEE